MLRGADEDAMPAADAIKNLVCVVCGAVRRPIETARPTFREALVRSTRREHCRHGPVMVSGEFAVAGTGVPL